MYLLVRCSRGSEVQGPGRPIDSKPVDGRLDQVVVHGVEGPDAHLGQGVCRLQEPGD